ncbi:MAG: hypothetical protein Q7T53_01995 [Deltaproteobacteria bacterium]|nr:hypothetical protein [Deltaproteobacteria bacterium]
MLHKKISSLFLILLILNLNMVVPAVSYAAAEETCSCHLNSADHQCHCEDGCNSCGMHKSSGQGSVVRGQSKLKTENLKLETEIKGMTCSTSPQGDNTVLPISAIPFMVPDFGTAIPVVLVSELQNLPENPLYGVTVTPSEKPPTA